MTHGCGVRSVLARFAGGATPDAEDARHVLDRVADGAPAGRRRECWGRVERDGREERALLFLGACHCSLRAHVK